MAEKKLIYARESNQLDVREPSVIEFNRKQAEVLLFFFFTFDSYIVTFSSRKVRIFSVRRFAGVPYTRCHLACWCETPTKKRLKSASRTMKDKIKSVMYTFHCARDYSLPVLQNL